MRQLLKILQDKYVRQLQEKDLSGIEEIRMYVGQPILLCFWDREEQCWPRCTADDLEEVILSACRQSVYAYTETLRHGYITVDGGHRIGVCGSGVLHNGSVQNINNITSLVIRVARQVLGCADMLLPYVNNSVLILGPPGSGKTTLLRDLIRLLSDKEQQKIAVVDERAEISAATRGSAQLQIGKRTNVLVNVPKAAAFMMLLRTMSPQWIAVDEITSAEDVGIMDQIAYCGVKLIATAHALDASELKKRPLYIELMKREIFQTFVVLSKDKSYSIQENLS